jgi:hypothetical protein
MEPAVGDELFRPPERGGWGDGLADG